MAHPLSILILAQIGELTSIKLVRKLRHKSPLTPGPTGVGIAGKTSLTSMPSSQKCEHEKVGFSKPWASALFEHLKQCQDRLGFAVYCSAAINVV